MRGISLLLLGTITLCASAADRAGRMLSFNMDFGNGVRFRIQQVAEPPVQWAIKSSGFFTSPNPSGGMKFHRVLVDDERKAYFGYDLITERLDGGQIRVWIEPLSVSVDDLKKHDRSDPPAEFGALRFLILPRYPEPQTVQPGDTIALKLLSTPYGTQTILDYIDFSDSDPVVPPRK